MDLFTFLFVYCSQVLSFPGSNRVCKNLVWQNGDSEASLLWFRFNNIIWNTFAFFLRCNYLHFLLVDFCSVSGYWCKFLTSSPSNKIRMIKKVVVHTQNLLWKRPKIIQLTLQNSKFQYPVRESFTAHDGPAWRMS